MDEKKFAKIIAVILVLTAVCFIFAGHFSPDRMLTERDVPIQFSGEYRIEGEEEWHLWTKEALTGYSQKKKVMFRGHFSQDLEKNQMLCVRISNIQTEMSVNGESIYTIGNGNELSWAMDSAGNGWDVIGLPMDIGVEDNVTFSVSYPYGTGAGIYITRFINEMYLGRGSMHLLKEIQGGLYNVVLSMMIVFFGIVLLMASFWFRNQWNHQFSLLMLGGLGVTVGFWLLMDFSYITLLIPNQVTCNLIDIVGKQFAFGFGYAFCAGNYKGKTKQLMLWISIVSFLRGASNEIIQLLGIADFYSYEERIAPIGYLTFIVALFVIVWNELTDEKRDVSQSTLPFLLIMAGLVMNLIWYYCGYTVPTPIFWIRIFVLAFFAVEIMGLYRLMRKRDVESRVNEARWEFLAKMSHDIRTPMNAVLGYTQLAQTYCNDGVRVEEYLAKVEASGEYLLALINDTLEFAKNEHQQIELHEERCTLEHIMQRALVNVRPLAEQREQNLIVHDEEVFHKRYLADILRINQILVNVLSNAVKYTGVGGTILFEAREVETTEERVSLEFTVADNGMGMPPDYLEHIFDWYSRNTNEDTKKIEGTGIGMTVTKNLVDVMGGSIRVESTEGKGSAFYITLNLKIDAEAEENPDEEQIREHYSFLGKRFLVVEDNDINADLIEELLEERGSVSERAVDGMEAVEILQKKPINYYDAVFMDMQMPRMNGCEATEAIRRLEREDAKSIWILAMSANAFQEDEDAAFAAGMNAYVPKPVDMKRLERALYELQEEKKDDDSNML